MKILCCYNVNIDSVCTVDGARITDYIKNHEINDPPDQIRDMSDFLALLLMHIKNGTGGEYLLETPAAIEKCRL